MILGDDQSVYLGASVQYCERTSVVGRPIRMSARPKRRDNKRILGNVWRPAVILTVLVIVAYGVHTIRGNNDAISYPPATSTIPATVVQINPKNVTYEAFGTLGNGGRVVYADLDSQPIAVTLASLPWSHSETTMSASATLSLVMQVDGDSAGCRILVNGQVRDEHLVSHQGAAVACTVTAA
jgi:Mycobacterium membrane protein